MPNWASSTYRLVGTKENCENARKVLEEICQQDNAGWFGYMNATICPVFTYSRIDSIVKTSDWELPVGDCRAWINDVDESPTHIGTKDDPSADRYFIEFFAQEAWGMHPNIVQMFADVFNLRLNGVCEEPGMQEYYKIDPDHVFSEYIYSLDANTPGGFGTACGTYDDIIECLDEWPCWNDFLKAKQLDPDTETFDLRSAISQFDDWMQETYDDADYYACCFKFQPDQLTPGIMEISDRAMECLVECYHQEAAKTADPDATLEALAKQTADSLAELSKRATEPMVETTKPTEVTSNTDHNNEQNNESIH